MRGEGSQRSMIPRIFAHVVQSPLASAPERAQPQIAGADYGDSAFYRHATRRLRRGFAGQIE